MSGDIDVYRLAVEAIEALREVIRSVKGGGKVRVDTAHRLIERADVMVLTEREPRIQMVADYARNPVDAVEQKMNEAANNISQARFAMLVHARMALAVALDALDDADLAGAYADEHRDLSIVMRDLAAYVDADPAARDVAALSLPPAAPDYPTQLVAAFEAVDPKNAPR